MVFHCVCLPPASAGGFLLYLQTNANKRGLLANVCPRNSINSGQINCTYDFFRFAFRIKRIALYFSIYFQLITLKTPFVN